MGIFSFLRREKRSTGTQQITGQPVNYSDFTSLFNSWFGAFQNKAKVPVTPETSLTVSTFYSCVRNIAEDISKLPFKILLTKTDGNRFPLYNHPAYKLLGLRPNSFSTPFTLLETWIATALIRGNGYIFIERDEKTAEPIALYFLRPESCYPILKDRKIYYNVNDVQLNISGTFTSESILHLRGMGDGFMGKSVIVYASESIGKAIATQQYGGSFFGSTGLKGILKFQNKADEQKLKAAKESFQRTYEEDGLAVVGSSGIEYEKQQINNNEAQFIESQDFNVSDIARWFRMPLSKLQKDANTGGEQEAIDYVTNCLLPWVERITQEIEAKLFKESEKFICDATFSFDILLKGDTAAQERRIKTMFMTGAWSPNDVRRFMDYNTVNEDSAKEKYLPVNMIPASQVGDFWKGKQADQNTLTTASPDSSGSGNVNANIN
jgi:HK97 family phage portal protein